MSKDPAALLYIDKWVSATLGMRSEARAWYMDMILYQFDKGPLPNDMDELAGIAKVLPSEYAKFEQVYKQVLKQKFKQNEEGTLENPFASEIISKRKTFKDKRSKSGSIGVIVKAAKALMWPDGAISALKDDLYKKNLEEIEHIKNKQVLKQMLKLYINEDVDVDEDINILKKKGGVGESPDQVASSVAFPSEDTKELLNSLCQTFSVSELSNPQSYFLLSHFVRTTTLTKQIFLAYLSYKKKSGEKLHGLKGFVGSRERNYTDGAWCEVDWVYKNTSTNTEKSKFPEDPDPGWEKNCKDTALMMEACKYWRENGWIKVKIPNSNFYKWKKK